MIDIINYSDEQFSRLNAEQIEEIRTVQFKKDAYTKKLAEDKRREKYRLIREGIFRSGIFEQICEELDDEYNFNIENLHDGLMFYLQYTARTDNPAPYNVDYALSYYERYVEVRHYYDTHFETGLARFAAYAADTVALSYLGEYYTPLYDYYRLHQNNS